ncbi:uncharacterized protein METZ01_LOCUS236423, partial [marine metagenome]
LVVKKGKDFFIFFSIIIIVRFVSFFVWPCGSCLVLSIIGFVVVF